MGRLLKKKTSDQKKKKRIKAVGELTDNGENTAVEKKVVSQSEFSKDSVKKQVLFGKKSNTGAKPLKKKSQSDNFLNKSIQFLREVKIELKKVTWPSRIQTMGTTGIVIVLVIIISLFLGLVDLSLTKIISVVLR